MRNSFVPFIIAAVFCALFADKIGMAVKGDKKVKKVNIVFSAGILLVCAITAIAGVLSYPPGYDKTVFVG